MNSKEHFLIGAGIALLANCFQQRKDHSYINLRDALAWSIIGGAGALLPDILEPATNPNHRDLFHSISFGLGLAIINNNLQKNEKLSEETKKFMGLMSLVYGSHLLADSTTPKEIPLF